MCDLGVPRRTRVTPTRWISSERGKPQASESGRAFFCFRFLCASKENEVAQLGEIQPTKPLDKQRGKPTQKNRKQTTKKAPQCNPPRGFQKRPIAQQSTLYISYQTDDAKQ